MNVCKQAGENLPILPELPRSGNARGKSSIFLLLLFLLLFLFLLLLVFVKVAISGVLQ